MSFFTSWLFSLADAIVNVSEYGLERDAVNNLFKILGYDGVYDNKYMPMSVEKMIYLLGDLDENYTNEEIEYMGYSNIAKRLFTLEKDEEDEVISFYYIEIDSNEIEKDNIACAIIKLFNKAFKGLNCYIIKNDKTFCFGAKYIGAANMTDDFIITRWLETDEDSQERVGQFAAENIEVDTIYETFMNFLETVISNSHLIKKEIFSTYSELKDKTFDLIFSLGEISRLYNIDCSRIIEEYENWFDSSIEEVEFNQYEKIAYNLRNITSNVVSSYEMLEIAATSEEKSKEYQNNKNLSLKDSFKEDEIDIKINSLDDEVFEDVEKILHYI